MTQASAEKRKGISLRTRLTLTTMAIIVLMALALTAASMFNANRLIFNTAVSGDSAGESNESAGATVQSMGAQQDGSASDAEEDGITYAATENSDTEMPIAQASASFGRLSLWAMLAIIVVGGILTYAAVGHALKPLNTLTAHISSVSEHALATRLESKHDDEVGTLVAAFNRLMARLEKVFDQQRSFASAAAHELKTPLAAIKANVDVLEMDEKPTVAEYEILANVTKQQTDRMIHLVDDLFSISMGEAYDFEDELDLPKLLETLVEERRHAIDARGTQITVHAQCRHQLLCNMAMVRHALSNLLDNAVKYNVEGGTVDITALETDKGFVVTIADTGIGIPQEHQPHVFEPFYRVDKSRSRKMGGAGLGLSIAHDMIERHGGRISLWSNEPMGMVFTVELPKLDRDV